MLFILILLTTNKSTGNKFQSTLTNANQNNQSILSSINNESTHKDIKNLSFVIKLVKFKKLNFAKSDFFKMEFLSSEIQKVFIYL